MLGYKFNSLDSGVMFIGHYQYNITPLHSKQIVFLVDT